ncbi:MAG: hypothetical protein PUG31_00450 [Eubacteriales bacterium]|jgi:hypothetical protein|nr:hypothetical protein [Clostridiales bacterium]MDD7395890.1 hypothetical protein [Eubacteriales bacterium]MDY2983307.1 hypothetical protein [Eubacteriales bacterium]
MISIVYYAVISLLSLLLLASMLKKRPVYELISLAVILVTFALRALHIK